MIWLLFALIGLTWLIFASIQDLKTKEVANWLSFSLLAIGLGTRLIFAISTGEMEIFYYGIASTSFVGFLAYALYYSRVFAGGDLKLMRGLGTMIPGESLRAVLVNSAAATGALLVAGAAYSLLASGVVAVRRKKDFQREFNKEKKKYFYILPIVIALWAAFRANDAYGVWLLSFLSFTLVAYPYFKAIDRCMIRLYNPRELTEGDWLEENVRIGNKTICKSVHGLSRNEIRMLVRARKKVLIKEGIAFVPAFLIAFAFMALFFALKGPSYLTLFLETLF